MMKKKAVVFVSFEANIVAITAIHSSTVITITERHGSARVHGVF